MRSRLEAECCTRCFGTDDHKEGMKAFLEKEETGIDRQIETNAQEVPDEFCPYG